MGRLTLLLRCLCPGTLCRELFAFSPYSAYTHCPLLQSAFFGTAVNANRERKWPWHDIGFSSFRCDFVPRKYENAFVTVPRAILPALSIVLSLRRGSFVPFLLYLDVGVLRVVTTGPFSLNAPFYWVFRIVLRSRKLTLWSIRLLKIGLFLATLKAAMTELYKAGPSREVTGNLFSTFT